MAVVLARVVLDWIPPVDSGVQRRLVLWSHLLTEPLLGPMRRLMPMIPLGQGAALDLSPALLMFLLFLAQALVARYIG